MTLEKIILTLNDFIPFIGVALTLFVYGFSKINTKNISIQITYIMFFIMWCMLYLADYSSTFQPNIQSSIGRMLILTIEITLSIYVYAITDCVDGLRKDILSYAKSKKVKDHLPCLEVITPTQENLINDSKK
jgi:hypothetical protein